MLNVSGHSHIANVLEHPFKYETHVHSYPGSGCGAMPPEEVVELYAQNGFSGLFLTDHFTGNCGIPRELPWEERVRQFCDCIRRAQRKGDEIGLHVFFGYEYSYQGADFLILNTNEKFLHDHPDLPEWDVLDFLARVREDGAFVVHAHPCRQGAWIVDPCRRFPDHVDAVEVFNPSHDLSYNPPAEVYAEECGLLRFSGSDNHPPRRFNNAGLAFRENPATAGEFVRLVKASDYVLIT